MPIPTNNKRLALLACVGAIIGIALYVRQPDAEPSATAAIDVPAAPVARYGPGAWTEPSKSSSMQAGSEYGTAPPDGLAAANNQQLVVNLALRDVFDFFLLSGQDGDSASRQSELIAYLKSKLPARACDEAAAILARYLAYMTAHDNLLARQQLAASASGNTMSPQDVGRLNTWAQQRARLRQSMLGADVARVWYQDEEMQLQQILSDLRRRTDGAASDDASAQEQDGNAMRNTHVYGVNQAARQERQGQAAIDQAGKSFATRAREEREWSIRYANFRRAGDQIARQDGITAVERQNRIEALRTQSFVSDAERLRSMRIQ